VTADEALSLPGGFEWELDLSLIERVVAAFSHPESELIGILQEVERVYGYLPEAVVNEVARLTGVPASRIYGVITFYAQFSTVPKGRHKVCVCEGTACHVRGGQGVLRVVKGRLGLKPGETSADLAFTLETVSCLGACSLAPVVTVDGQYYGKLTASKALAAIDTASGKDDDAESDDYSDAETGPHGGAEGDDGL